MKALALLLAACSGGAAQHDAPGPCWPLDAQPGGHVELGTGDGAFEPMPDVLMVQRNASQSDPFLLIQARMSGFPPGSSTDLFDPSNPHTKVSARIDALDLTLGVMCPGSIGYVPSGIPDTYDLLRAVRLGFGFSFPVEQADGQQALITLDIVGSNGLTAHAEKTVTLQVPMTDAVDAGVD